MPLICFDCHNRRNKIASPVLNKVKGIERIIGWVCLKCYKKRQVAQRPRGVGWRMAWRDLFFAMKKQLEKK